MSAVSQAKMCQRSIRLRLPIGQQVTTFSRQSMQQNNARISNPRPRVSTILCAVELRRFSVKSNQFKMTPRHVVTTRSSDNSVNNRLIVRPSQRPISRDALKIGKRSVIRNSIVGVDNIMMKNRFGQRVDFPIRSRNLHRKIRERGFSESRGVIKGCRVKEGTNVKRVFQWLPRACNGRCVQRKVFAPMPQTK